MKRGFFFVFLALAQLGMISPAAFATNGDNLIGIGPISRAMGGVGVAAPQDAISAIFANPAAMCFGSYCPGSEAVFGGTYFDPTVKSKVDLSRLGFGQGVAKSRMKPFVVPAIGVTSPITERLRFGIGAYGVSGMGVDYKERGAIYRDPNTGQDLYTKLEIMKFAPNLAYLVTPNFSVGMSLSIDYGNADFGSGGAHNYTMGLQVGALYHMGIFNFGASYITPQKITHERVYDFDGNGTLDDLKLQSPHTLIFGVAAEPSPELLAEADVRWYNWADAKGYEDFDWDNQWVIALGVQYRPIGPLALRAGFNYGKNPVNEHNGFNIMGVTPIQGVNVSTLNYEMLRIVGFPAIVEKHLTLGIGYDLTERLILNLTYMHAFEKTIKEVSAGNMASLESSLSERSYSFGLTWRF
jgi:long-chain fatty acid transport protein